MTSAKVDQDPETKIAGTESRREALKRFGRYAAVAPATMVLLKPREGHATWWWWRGRWWWKHKNDDDYFDD